MRRDNVVDLPGQFPLEFFKDGRGLRLVDFSDDEEVDITSGLLLSPGEAAV